jgi:two-component system, OmpR family, sensor kinase
LAAGRTASAGRGEGFTQVIDARGRVVDATGGPSTRSVLTGQELARARGGAVVLDRESVPGLEDEWRLLATPVQAGAQRFVVVVGASIEGREETVGMLGGLLLLGGPVALLLASLAGYGLAAGALRPVEAMRRRAAAISAATPGERLPVPEAQDELSRLGETLNAMLERLESALERERRFVADASHELRTPLALVRTELDLAFRRRRSLDELEQALHSVAEETDRMAQLADDLLLLARSDGKGQSVRPAPFDVADLLESVTARYADRAAAAGRALECRCPAGLTVKADRSRVEQALANLVENALRHGAGRVSVAAVERDGAVELRVSDEGAGFPPEFLAHAFERFSRADEARGRGGAGLGLSIVEAVAAAHGGAAGASNRDQGGAEAWLSLPVQPRY